MENETEQEQPVVKEKGRKTIMDLLADFKPMEVEQNGSKNKEECIGEEQEEAQKTLSTRLDNSKVAASVSQQEESQCYFEGQQDATKEQEETKIDKATECIYW